jgi:hypothetical protein
MVIEPQQTQRDLASLILSLFHGPASLDSRAASTTCSGRVDRSPPSTILTAKSPTTVEHEGMGGSGFFVDRRPSETPTQHGYAAAMVVAYVLLAAPVVAAFLFWGAWGWVAAAAVVAAIQYATLQRSQRFSARVWRSIGVTRRGKRERGVETIYVISAAVGVALLVGSLLGIG